MKKIIEGRWACTYCQTKDILGRYQACPNCGRQRDKSFKPKLPSDIKSNYVPEEQAKNISRNPDWFCSFCQSYNSDKLSNCSCCGASRKDSEGNFFEIQQKLMEEKQKKEKEEKVESNYEFYKKDSTKETSSSSKTAISYLKKSINYLLIGLLLCAFIVGIIYLVTPKEISMDVTEFSWSRSIEIQILKTLEENDWELPEGARLKYTQEEVFDYDKVIDHYETKETEVETEVIVGYEEKTLSITDLGNGFFEEETTEVPIYETRIKKETYKEPFYVYIPVKKTKYYYEIDRWVHERSIDTFGTDKSPYWGDVVLKEGERESSRNTTYRITGIVKDKSKTFIFSEEDWKKIEIGDTIRVKEIFGFATLIEN